jgi:NAD+ diphosphatase
MITRIEGKFTSAVTPPSGKYEPAYWFIFDRFRLLVHSDNSAFWIPLISDPAKLNISLLRSQYLGYLKQGEVIIHCYSGEVAEENPAPEGMEFLGLRQLFGRIDDETLALAGRAVQIKEWDKTHQYCGQCGSEVFHVKHERAKKCPKCAHTTYPRLAPAVIVRIERPSQSGSEILLARNQRHPAGFFSVLAGFVEPGESLEECVRREVREEVGIEIQNIQYFGSQPWPFPNSLMIAFTAEYASGAIRLEEEEIVEAGWYKAGTLPKVPPRVSIARQMIDAFVEKNSQSV